MKNLITEARELCERATPGPWEVKLHNEDYGQGYGETTFFVDTDGTLLKIGIADAAEKYAKYNALSAFIARSRTLIPELCDALEKAAKKNEELMRELSQLARESVEREKNLAWLEAEVEDALREQAEMEKGCEWCSEFEDLPEHFENGVAVGKVFDTCIQPDEKGRWHIELPRGADIGIRFCPMCGKRLEDKPCG